MVNGDYLILNIHAGSQLACAADQDTDFSLTGTLKQLLPLCFRSGVVNKGYLRFRHTLCQQHISYFIIYIEFPGFGSANITKDKLRGSRGGGVLPNLINILNADTQLASCTIRIRSNQARVNRHQASLTGQLQHIIFFRLHSASSDCFCPHDKIGHNCLLCGGRFHRNNLRFTSANSRESGNIQHIRCFDVSDLTKDSHQFREIVETDEAITHPIAAALRLQFQHRGSFGKMSDPGVEVGPAKAFQLLRLQIPLHDEQFGNRVADWRSSRKYYAAPLICFLQILTFEQHIKGALTA